MPTSTAKWVGEVCAHPRQRSHTLFSGSTTEANGVEDTSDAQRCRQLQSHTSGNDLQPPKKDILQQCGAIETGEAAVGGGEPGADEKRNYQIA